MPTFTVITKPPCPACENAKSMIAAAGFQLVDLNILTDDNAKRKLLAYFKAKNLRPTVPLIIDNTNNVYMTFADLPNYLKNLQQE